jgi:multidrug transporter EmrE-like cation transporter
MSCFGLYKLKMSNVILDQNFIIGFMTYGAGFVVWLIILKMNPLSIAFPIASGCLVIGTQIVGIYYLNEKTNWLQIAGVCLIIAGIILIYAKR